ncbi:MAG TPA: ABC transporter permease [Solirubrobacteraceae bacterium]|jgi:peptide/nickel transport system permease protein|nr:ABC transporter permease [Solirubrobacteraceae bacterium]
MSIGAVPVESTAALNSAQAEVRRREFLRELTRQKAFIAGAIIVGFWILAAIFGTLVVQDPLAQNLSAINQAPSGAHLFGTDQLGRDVLARVIVGARPVLIVAPLATLIGTVFGTALGLVMGYYRGVVDDVVGRFVEAFLALPLVVTGILGVVALGSSNATLIIVIGIVFTPLIARTVRAAVLVERDLDYVAAARLRGESSLYIMFAEILPNILAPIMVEFTVRLGYAVFTIITLSFLGFGLQPPTPNWGSEIFTNISEVGAGYWWEVLFDAIAVASLVVGVNLIANSIETALDAS